MRDYSRHVTSIGGLDVLFVMATEQEYGAHLRARIDPLVCGVGPVEAATVTTAALGTLAHTGRRPHLVCSLGSAGSRNLDHCGIYQAASISYRDMDASAFGFEKGVTPFLGLPATVVLPHRIEGVAAASLATGASVVSGAAYDSITADMVDMESFAVLRAAQLFGIPLVGLRGISDGRTDVATLEDWTEYLAIIDEKLAMAIDLLAAQASHGTFTV
ncbi:5'-methylthioadenosine/S-adenosylhomocysteine nucleosidase [Segnochrobactrum spirostomi]|uniref:5'-methylthioadenosine/S-adenosylhomocysteine nucleosidase n=1 Tax=Segnochrobactrum spirostomi TaxID=2608987 RepID=A0A6A7Y6D5_9HYPH|nr:5'-methylthioadenosine/S-adenosylhomocysteine nucleosidase [Segnochrobactrum spirostomi]MQT14265.1 5'-methylthioadenosine/S-adenosylhomocysteine nucleosidase [Segnochrobactrum spirostomi]